MFTKISAFVQPIVRKVEAIRAQRGECAADRIIARDPCSDEVYTYIDGQPVTYREFNRMLRQDVRRSLSSIDQRQG